MLRIRSLLCTAEPWVQANMAQLTADEGLHIGRPNPEKRIYDGNYCLIVQIGKHSVGNY